MMGWGFEATSQTKASTVSTQEQTFEARIDRMNAVFEIDRNNKPVCLGSVRLEQFRSILGEEFQEIDEIITLLKDLEGRVDFRGIDLRQAFENPLFNGEEAERLAEVLTKLADLLGDITVYVFSEARRWGIPILPVLHAIMDSQDSKLVDGEPLKDERNKFIKGPNYVPPEEKIKSILKD